MPVQVSQPLAGLTVGCHGTYGVVDETTVRAAPFSRESEHFFGSGIEQLSGRLMQVLFGNIRPYQHTDRLPHAAGIPGVVYAHRQVMLSACQFPSNLHREGLIPALSTAVVFTDIAPVYPQSQLLINSSEVQIYMLTCRELRHMDIGTIPARAPLAALFTPESPRLYRLPAVQRCLRQEPRLTGACITLVPSKAPAGHGQLHQL